MTFLEFWMTHPEKGEGGKRKSKKTIRLDLFCFAVI